MQFLPDGHQRTHFWFKKLRISKDLFIFCAVYFISDFIFGIKNKYNDTAMRIHHIYAILALTYTLYKNQYEGNILRAIAIKEISNPFLFLLKNWLVIPKYQKFAFLLSFIFVIICLPVRTYFASFYILAMQASPVCFYLKVPSGIICFLISAYFILLCVHHS